MKERLENELEGLKTQQKLMKEELYSELAELKLEQELQDKKDKLYKELEDLKSIQSQMSQESVSSDDESSYSDPFDSNEETIPTTSPVKAVAFQSDLENQEEEFYY